jgi:HAD superfamily hydrolase (TIGR01509 family)
VLTNTDLVIFDMDGVLFDTERLAVAAWQEAARLLGVHIPEPVIVETIGLSAENTRQVYRRHLGDGFAYDDVLQERLRIGWEQVREGAPVKPGVQDLLAFLDRRGTRAALATSTSARRAIHLLTTAGMMDSFAAVVTGDQVARSKPAPDLFLEAARRCGVQPGRCLVVEDSDFGIMAAHSAGMRTVFVRDIKAPDEAALGLTEGRFACLDGLLAWMR